jgi:hypothetical protein
MDKLVYAPITYAENHWACQIPTEKIEDFIVVVTKNNYSFLVKLNPTDSRGYRTIVQYIGHTSFKSYLCNKFKGLTQYSINETFNRPYTIEEKSALFAVTSEITQHYETLGLFPQIEYAGNNSHEFKNSIMYVGKHTEPSMLHSHIICRGDPEHSYIDDVKLRGPIPGELFNMRDGKTKWEIDEMLKVSTKIRNMQNKYTMNKNNIRLTKNILVFGICATVLTGVLYKNYINILVHLKN